MMKVKSSEKEKLINPPRFVPTRLANFVELQQLILANSKKFQHTWNCSIWNLHGVHPNKSRVPLKNKPVNRSVLPLPGFYMNRALVSERGNVVDMFRRVSFLTLHNCGYRCSLTPHTYTCTHNLGEKIQEACSEWA